ncbi:hypothetical protein DPMN_029020 [Dreissena polymorpha]|uniref:Uncharacterized protein n=1 Tax=Dreissena polymorpha TaxID=45954 RepID=A0A9D4LVQ4_DREPO|nr:hypothetical protein DPMN_029020 [Dreissena polymorpha]
MFKPFGNMFYCNSICFMHFCQHFRNDISLPTHPAVSQAQFPGHNPINDMFFGAVLNVQNLNIYEQPPQ